MNVLAYSSQNPDKVAPKVEDLLRRETGAEMPIRYEVAPGATERPAVGTVLKEGLALIFGKEETLLFSLGFDIAQPRPAHLEVHMNRQGVGCHAGALLYSIRLAKPVAGEVWLEDPRAFGNSKFIGEPQTAERLNGNRELLKAVNRFSRTKSDIGGLSVSIPRFFKIAPADGSAALVAATLGQPHFLGFKMSMGAKEFFEIVKMIEDAL
jgi:hypothetical protein